MAKTEAVEKNDGGRAARVMELKRELRRLVNAIVAEEEDCRVEIYDRALETLTALKSCKFRKSSPLKTGDNMDFPNQFLCPITKELMTDPVIISSGETYERQFIQAHLDAGHRTCPKTQQVLSPTYVIPNKFATEMISQWFVMKGTQVPSPVFDTKNAITKGDKERFNSMLNAVGASSLPEQKQAAKELRSWTKKTPSFRTLFGEKHDSIPRLLSPLSMGRNHCPPDLQEDLVTTVLNISILDENKKLLAETEAIPLLIQSLSDATIETRTNAAAALFSLSALDSNKSIIGSAGALKPLIELLEEGHPLAMKDAASAIFNLCISHSNKARAVHDGAVKVVLQKIKEGNRVDEMLSILAILSGNQEAVDEMGALGAVSILLGIIGESSCARSKENSIAILHSICHNDRSKLKEIREEENTYATISHLAQTGTSRARRKATSILERLDRVNALTHTA